MSTNQLGIAQFQLVALGLFLEFCKDKLILTSEESNRLLIEWVERLFPESSKGILEEQAAIGQIKTDAEWF